ncbi:NUDIX hydrolase [Bacillus sp. 1P06AnD]|uniref:NUDIX hydrolase n=1 Tax=Bacillus sp. 1P06AnD TaxID=3132208 RepID=UPI0039A034EA
MEGTECKKADLETEIGGTILKCRSAGFIVKQDKILLHKGKKEQFWAPVGGKIQAMESSEETVAREYKEELGIEVKVERLLWMAEHFYTYDSKRYQEYCFIYLLKDVHGVLNGKDTDFSRADDPSFEYRWFPFDESNSLPFKPRFLEGKLDQMPEAFVHLIDRD